ncbi:MBL fold metallo-hydrolase [Emticicia sp.]|uniref:MBL fold metallo-hydrolase n=1 Tax=Emticicia sp. TaxID=1930953 RepID=UPI003751D076
MKTIISLVLLITILWVASCTKESVCDGPPKVSAGMDVSLVDMTSVTLTGTSSAVEGGVWSIISGDGGEISNGKFTGKLKSKYSLKWESKNDCGISSDTLNITLNAGFGSKLTVNEVVENIHWIEQACFRIESGAYTIYTDPNSISVKDTADIVLITHPHSDHYTATNLDKLIGPNTILIAPQEIQYAGKIAQRIILKPGEEYSAFGGISIKAVPAYNIIKNNHPKANNWVGYLITVNGVTIYQAGDTERVPEMKTFTTDIAMLPLGQTFTFPSVMEAAEAAKDVKAKVLIPMHFGLAEGKADDAITVRKLLEGVMPVVIKIKGK